MRGRRHSSVISTKYLYGSEDLEDDVSIYDDIQDHHYPDGNEDPVYIDVFADETEGCDQGSAPELPSPRPASTSEDQNQDRGYQALKEKKPDHIYLPVIKNETEEGDECEEDIKAEDQDQDQITKPEEEEDKRSAFQDQDKDQDNNTQYQGRDQASKPHVQTYRH